MSLLSSVNFDLVEIVSKLFIISVFWSSRNSVYYLMIYSVDIEGGKIQYHKIMRCAYTFDLYMSVDIGIECRLWCEIGNLD